MLTTTRFISAAAIVGGISVVGVITWVTGVLATITDTISDLWHDLITWLNEPWGFEQMLAGAGSIVAVLVIFGLIVLVLSGE